MTFNENSRIDTSRVRKRGRTAATVGGGSALVVIGGALISQFLGVDVTGLLSSLFGGGGSSSVEETTLEGCTTGADANDDIECRIAGTADSLDDYWAKTLPELGVSYTSTEIVLFDGATQSGCGAASSAMGPFYCPTDRTIYMDVAFYQELRTEFGASGGPLAQMYVVAHEWGHHIQNISGIMDGLNLRASGPASDSVRLELQADCFAGSWVKAASSTTDAQGTALLKPPTRAEVADALDAASRIGDDSIQQNAGMSVNPEGFTHGTSEQRQRWFATGYDGGPNACTTFEVSAGKL